MVPVQTLEASALAFTGHRWGEFRYSHPQSSPVTASRKEIQTIMLPAFKSCIIALLVEVPLCLLLSFLGARPYAQWISGSSAVATITARMWRTIDWYYIFYALSTQLATILLSTIPRWYLYQSLVSNLLYVLPWAIVCQVKQLDAKNAWTYHSLVFGGSLVFSFFDVLIFLALWTWKLRKGGLRAGIIRQA